MMRKILLSFLLLFALHAKSQSYEDELLEFRQDYKMGLMHSAHPLKAEDTGYLRFYAPDPNYRVKAVFTLVTGTKPFMMKTMHGDKRPTVREYGKVWFNLKGGPVTLRIYRFLTDNPDGSMRLFIPFTDRTNYKETFGGGRYLDVPPDDLPSGNVVLDFNKCYNPHAAYEKGYPYIIPPAINNLRIEIRAGEKIFGHNPGY